MSEQIFMVFDVESVGLHGEGFAAGYVVVDRKGELIDEGVFACDPATALGDDAGRAWIAENVTTHEDAVPCDDPADVRHEFWSYWMKHKERGATLWADCCWPVEARFLAACIDDDIETRRWQGPYPLHDVATLRLSAGLDPLATVDRLADELPAHEPLADARQSARLLIEALDKIQSGAAPR